MKNELIHSKRRKQPRLDKNLSTLRVTVSVCPTLFIYYIAVQCHLANGCLGMAIEAGERLIAHQNNCGVSRGASDIPLSRYGSLSAYEWIGSFKESVYVMI